MVMLLATEEDGRAFGVTTQWSPLHWGKWQQSSDEMQLLYRRVFEVYRAPSLSWVGQKRGIATGSARMI